MNKNSLVLYDGAVDLFNSFTAFLCMEMIPAQEDESLETQSSSQKERVRFANRLIAVTQVVNECRYKEKDLGKLSETLQTLTKLAHQYEDIPSQKSPACAHRAEAMA